MINKNTQLQAILELAHACSCEKCNHGCTMGSGIAMDEDIIKISSFLGKTKEETTSEFFEETFQFNKKHLRPKILREGKKTYGTCIFFKENKCSIHLIKPLQCKVAMGCKPFGEDLMKWFVANYLLDSSDPESVRQYISYSKFNHPIVGGKIEEIILDKERLSKIISFDVL